MIRFVYSMGISILFCLALATSIVDAKVSSTTQAPFHSNSTVITTTTASVHANRSLLNRQLAASDRPYELWEASKLKQMMQDMQREYPDFVYLTTAQNKYGLPVAGGPDDCKYENGNGCLNYILEIQDYTKHPQGSPSSDLLPDVVWSGALHGNERVGPTVVVETSLLMVECAACEALPKKPSDIPKALECRSELRSKGIDDANRKWIARLVSSRKLVVVPTANALGYDRNTRREGPIDPNRDFPYDLLDYTKCMQSIAARTLNEVYREHLVQMALTIHAGIKLIAFEWGSPWSYNSSCPGCTKSPDDIAQEKISQAFSGYGGDWGGNSAYKYGTMNDILYYVRGGMEDWAYAASWTPQYTGACDPNTFGGYPREKTIYESSTLRAFNILIETSAPKTPSPDTLGTSKDILNPETSGNGHVSRNIRLSLLSADLVEPYVSLLAVNDLALEDDVVPMQSNQDPKSCQTTKAVEVSQEESHIDMEWTVGGALNIDETQLWYAKWDDMPDSFDCWQQPSDQEVQFLTAAGNSFSGTGMFSDQGSNPNGNSLTGTTLSHGPLFRARVPLDGLVPGDKLLVMASAKVDQSWKDLPSNGDVEPRVSPQSHIVNVRTDPNYFQQSSSSNGKTIRGRLNWFSVPLTVVIGANGEPTTVVELNSRWKEEEDPTQSPTLSPSQRPTSNPTIRATEDPTQSPTLSPSQRPTSNPTIRATPTPQARCDNKRDPFVVRNKEWTCQQVANLTNKTRNKKCKVGKISRSCPGICNDRGRCPCANSPFAFRWNNKRTTCRALARLPARTRRIRCRKQKVSSNCRGICNEEVCSDSQ